ncbi:hypothetical protein HDV63DRAFT_383549 [Trichoderma sp. SZMC 28014]
MNPSPSVSALEALHNHLGLKYGVYASKIEFIWRSFSKEQRAIYFNAGAPDREALKQSLDASLGIAYDIAPELNLQDISTKPEFLLDHLKHRVATSLFYQYCDGVHEKRGDRNVIIEMTRDSYARHIDPHKLSFGLFRDKPYGHFIDITSHHDEALSVFKPLILAGYCVPRSIGELILKRQLVILQTLALVVDNILYNKILALSSIRREYQKYMSQESEQAPSAALSNLTIQERPKKLTIMDLIASARDHKVKFEAFLSLLSTDDFELGHAVSIWLLSHPGLVTDDKGCHLPAISNENINGAIFDIVHNTIKGATIWNYLCRLLDLLQSSNTDRIYRPIILQEISNICHLEYSRAQVQLTRHVQRGLGAKYFRRDTDSYDSVGNAKINLTIQPKELTRVDPRLHYILRLCQFQTNANKAIEWIRKLDNLYQSQPIDQTPLEERETDTLEYLIAVVKFIHDLSKVVPMPTLSRKRGQMFVSKSQDLEVELNKLRSQVHLPLTLLPMDNLQDVETVNEVLAELDQFVISKTGSKMGFLYQDLMEDCLADLEHQYQATKASLEKIKYIPLPTSSPQTVDERVEQRRVKEKTRPCQSTIFEIVQIPEAPKEEPI